MSLLLEYFPILCFFISFKLAGAYAEATAAWASAHLSFLVSGGQVLPSQAPVLISTLVVMLATLLVIGLQVSLKRRVPAMTWFSLALVVALGGATVWFHDETFIKWKPTGLYWTMALVFAVAPLLGKNLPKLLMQEHAQAPDSVWARLNWAWVAFGLFMGALNLWVAYRFTLDAWVNFKLFGGIGLMLLFLLGQAYLLSPYLREADKPEPEPLGEQAKAKHP
jgi:intracellular septation protein